MTDNWYGLIIDDYTAIMPLPCRKKFGINYLYTPPFMQQLGLIGEEEIDANAVIKAVQTFASYGDYLFNFENSFIQSPDSVKSCNNFIFDLSVGYETLYKNYSTNLQRNLKKVQSENLEYYISEDIQQTLHLHRQLQSKNISHVTAHDYHRFKNLCILLKEKDQCIVRQVKNKNGEILSAALSLKDNRRIYNIINATTEEGKNINANHFLIDNIIQEFAGQNLLFDFEGSNITGVKNFYKMFGSINQPYFHWHYNNLPWPLKLFKH
ncbi:hypothetical protein GALL_172580 [mine drainage metagenome]|uniref:BioF2-like acetyltransferase domain-containing protein n=1 Tax=mine drainage metagenome TaxID=410659 RepID=A0A1J5S937_9ZZZZ